MKVELIAVTQPMDGKMSEALLERAGRMCYRSSKQGEPGRFLQNRISEGHESIIEHACASFEISGISRACSHQLVRHRVASYSQESQRYVDMSDPEFVVPPGVAENHAAKEVWDGFMAGVAETYRQLRAHGIRKEDARFILPNATATRIIVTMNYRELLHVFRLRISPHAQWEIRELGLRMLELVHSVAPNVFGALRAELKSQYPSFFTNTAW
ncbi:MAG: thymidylate synthase (FAD) [Anaerolineaceae bacterium 4572_32.2]|nr:MAG: thymidylate synthase (FAD) [Anaerolineaceae bacterium 4572_32.2]